MQKIILMGNLGKDPEERMTPSGATLITFTLAVTVKKGQVAWYDCNIWQHRKPLFEKMIPYLKKGSKVHIIGDFHLPTAYTDNSGSIQIRMKVEPISIDFAGSLNTESKMVVDYSEGCPL